VPFVRVSRDKRGYEYIYLVHTSIRRGKPPRSRVLYWYRTPPGVRVGREPFDPSVRRELETQYPEIAFDWEKLRVLPPFPADVEHWRERRRAERAAKQARRAAELEGSGAGPAPDTDPAETTPVPSPDEAVAGAGPESTVVAQPPAPSDADAARRGRRRRRRRSGRPPGEGPPSAGSRGDPGGGPPDAVEPADGPPESVPDSSEE
jgi:hypothetical protein